MDLFLNALIAAIMLVILLSLFRSEDQWSTVRIRFAFRFFTVQSNVFCAAAALLMCLFPDAGWTWALKYVGTAAVSVTMLTVLFFLGPTIGYRQLFHGRDLFMHLVNPLLALVSFCGFERRGLRFPLLLIGVLPVVLYGGLYLYKIMFAPEEKRWEDFYGFNKGGKWYVAIPAMLTASLLICLGLAALQKL